MELEDLEDLVDFRVSVEERPLLNHFCEYAANSPDIHTQTVLFLSQKHFGSPVPKRLDFMSKSLDGDTKRPSKSEIGDLQVSHLINQQILRLEIPMDDPARVAVVHSVNELVEEQLDLVRSHRMLVLRHVLLQVIVNVDEDEMKLLLGREVVDFSQSGLRWWYLTMLG